MYDTKHNAVLMRREECDQFFLVFTGILQGVMGLAPLDFIRLAGLHNRNVMIFRDPSKSGYMAGCSEGIRSFEELLAWQREILAGMPHVRKVYAIGVSSGALAAMLSVNHLGGECSWVFGPRIHSLKQLGTTEAVRAMVEYLSGRYQQVRANIVVPPPDYPRESRRRPGWDHTLLPIMLAQGQLQTLFPPLNAAAS